MTEKIQKILSARGVASRRRAEEMILAGRVACNGRVCTLGDRADPDVDRISVDGKVIPVEQKKVYLMLHKPRGFVTTLSDEKGRKNAAQLVADCGVRVYPVGRLDMDSEGLLLFTNDGEFANRLMHPRHEIPKTYRVIVDVCNERTLRDLQKPVELDGYMIRPPKVTIGAESNELFVTIHEGRNRQVRRMCAMAGMNVLRLVRISEGNLRLGGLQCGKWRYLTDVEVQDLKE